MGAVIDDPDGTIVAHPRTVIGDGVPDDVRIVGIAALAGDRGPGVFQDLRRGMKDVKRLIAGDHVRDPGERGLVGLLPETGPLQPDRFLRLPFRRDTPDGVACKAGAVHNRDSGNDCQQPVYEVSHGPAPF